MGLASSRGDEEDDELRCTRKLITNIGLEIDEILKKTRIYFQEL